MGSAGGRAAAPLGRPYRAASGRPFAGATGAAPAGHRLAAAAAAAAPESQEREKASWSRFVFAPAPPRAQRVQRAANHNLDRRCSTCPAQRRPPDGEREATLAGLSRVELGQRLALGSGVNAAAVCAPKRLPETHLFRPNWRQRCRSPRRRRRFVVGGGARLPNASAQTTAAAPKSEFEFELSSSSSWWLKPAPEPATSGAGSRCAKGLRRPPPARPAATVIAAGDWKRRRSAGRPAQTERGGRRTNKQRSRTVPSGRPNSGPLSLGRSAGLPPRSSHLAASISQLERPRSPNKQRPKLSPQTASERRRSVTPNS